MVKTSENRKKISVKDSASKAEGLGLKSVVHIASQFFPPTAAAYAAYDEFNRWKLFKFLDELDAGKIKLTDKDEQNYAMVHVFFSCWRYVERTLRTEKIALFARLFQNYCTERAFESEDRTETYAEYLAILDELSYREFQVLSILYQLENDPTYVPSTESGASYDDLRDEFWEKFKKKAETEAGVPKKEFNGFMTRLSRTGLYQPDVQGFFSSDKGVLTSNFHSFITALARDNSSEQIGR